MLASVRFEVSGLSFAVQTVRQLVLGMGMSPVAWSSRLSLPSFMGPHLRGPSFGSGPPVDGQLDGSMPTALAA